MGTPGQPRMVTRRAEACCLGWGTHRATGCRQVQSGQGPGVAPSQPEPPALSWAHAGGSSCPSSSHLGWGVQQQETVSGTGEGRGRSTQHREAQARPSKLVLELFAVHMPICFVIAWLFLEATGVSRKPESVDCVSSVWGV